LNILDGICHTLYKKKKGNILVLHSHSKSPENILYPCVNFRKSPFVLHRKKENVGYVLYFEG